MSALAWAIVAAIALIAAALIAAEQIAIRLDRAYEQGHADAMDAAHSAGIQAGIDAGWHDEGSAA